MGAPDPPRLNSTRLPTKPAEARPLMRSLTEGVADERFKGGTVVGNRQLAVGAADVEGWTEVAIGPDEEVGRSDDPAPVSGMIGSRGMAGT